MLVSVFGLGCILFVIMLRLMGIHRTLERIALALEKNNFRNGH